MIRQLLVTILPLSVLIFLTSLMMSDDGRAGKTGSPGEVICNDCHNSFTLNSGGGSISLQSTGMPAFEYTPGQTYNMSVTVGRSANSLFGVGIEALTSTNNNAGTLTITDATSTQIKNATVSAVSRRNIVHKLNGGANPASKVFIFDWTAPAAGTGNVTFYFAGVAANGNGMSSSDYVYASSQVFTEAACTTPAQPGTISGQTNICSGIGTSYSISAVAGATAYTWTLPSGWSGTSTSTSINVTSGTTSGNISVKANNACGSSLATTLAVSVSVISATINQTNVSCNGGNDGTATAVPAGGVSPYGYSWFPSGGNLATASNLSQGNYTVTITDAQGCTKTSSVTITQPAVVGGTTSNTNISCNGGTNGSATVTPTGGTSPYTFLWSPSGGNAATASNLSLGNYSVVITDSRGCTGSKSVTISQPAVITATTSKTNVLCNGQSNGNATVNVSGGTSPYSYSWSPTGGTNAIANNLSVGNYIVTVTDNHSCTGSFSVSITEPVALSVSASSTDVTCGLSDGTATALPSGGTAPYLFSWTTTPVQHSSIATNLGAGNYTATVTDANGCTKTQSVTVHQPSTLNVNSNSTNAICYSESNGTAQVIASGGSPGYSYSWNTIPVQTTATAINLTVGIYTATVSDAAGCSFSTSVSISEPSQLIANSGTDTSICETGGIIIGGSPTGSGGTAPYFYSWSPTTGLSSDSVSNPYASPSSTTQYTLSITDANNCLSISKTNLKVNQLPLPVITSSGDSLFTIQAYSYFWYLDNILVGTTNDPFYLASQNGNYTVTVNDSFGCSGTSAIFNFTTLGLNSISFKDELNVFPNPATDKIVVMVPEEAGNMNLVIYNISGQIVSQSILQSGKNIFDVSGFTEGIYNATVQKENYISVKRVLISR